MEIGNNLSKVSYSNYWELPAAVTNTNVKSHSLVILLVHNDCSSEQS